jgi:hypothetical protein
MRLIENLKYKRSAAVRLRAGRALRTLGAEALGAFLRLWNIAFPVPQPPSGPDDPSPIAKSAALREPALLSERRHANLKEVG